jgi:predicted nucleic acid-binding protein
MPVAKSFLDTNILIYSFSKDDKVKRKEAIKQINHYDRVISTQVLTEFCNICIRKLMMDPLKVEYSVNEILSNCNLTIVDLDTIKLGLYIQKKYHFSYYDSLMIASSLETKCELLLSEDMADGQIIEKSLTLCNIFKNII